MSVIFTRREKKITCDARRVNRRAENRMKLIKQEKQDVESKV